MIDASTTLQNPSLTLYAFHLRHSFSQDSGQPSPESKNLWEALAQLGTPLNSSKLKNFQQHLLPQEAEQQTDYQVLLQQGATSLRLDFSPPNQTNHLQGLICPFRLHDVYAADLTLSYPGNLATADLAQLNPQGALRLTPEQASLGQTLMFYAEPLAVVSAAAALATDCVHQILHEPMNCVAQGLFLSNPVFEFDGGKFESEPNRHILVWLNYQKMQSEQMNFVSQQLLLLLCCRHKILYAYRQSRWCDHQAKKIYSEVEEITQGFSRVAQAPDHLQRFQDQLRNLPQKAFEYTQQLRDLADHETTLQTNIENYQRQLEKLKQLPGNELTFLQQFLDHAQARLLRQIQIDREYLTPGQTLFQQLIDTIRGMAELEQAEGDRRLERTIQVVGVGLGVGAIFGSSSAFIDRPWRPPFSPNTVIHPFLSSLLISLFAAFITGFTIWHYTRPARGKLKAPPNPRTFFIDLEK
jgi:hypothetical protein